MRKLVFLAGVVAGFPAAAEVSRDWSAVIAENGLAGTAAAIEVLGEPTAEDLFALGGVRFLMVAEQAMQARWTVGATNPLAPLPLLQLWLPPNPAPQPARASLVAEVFRGALEQASAAEAALAAIPQGSDLGLTVRLEDLWFDIDSDGQRGAGEDLLPVALAAFGTVWVDQGESAALLPSVAVRFDTADVAWLRAYGELVSGVGELVLAFDPTAAIDRVMAGETDKLARFGDDSNATLRQWDSERWLDRLTMAIFALRQQPDAARVQAAAGHLKAMVGLNRQFWDLVALEGDNEAEWIPNGAQKAALGFELPPDTGAVWLGVLAELEAMLDGRLLVPHVAFPPGAGIDLAAWVAKPSALDPLGWFQGVDALPYAAKGPVISGEAWNAFDSLLSGRGGMVAVLLN